MKQIILTALFAIFTLTLSAQSLIFEKEDSVKMQQLFDSAPKQATTANYMTYFGSKLIGVPYVAKTLDRGKKENLVMNLRELDCTTFTESVFALSLCMKNEAKKLTEYSRYLRLLRYQRGHIAYETRQHYFTSWIESAKKNGFVSEPDYPAALKPAKKTLRINYMSTHKDLYPQLLDNQSLVDSIAKTEKQLTGTSFTYIPKSQLRKYQSLKKIVHNGDIIVIITNKAGLDTSHIGIASWHKDGTLHLLNASQIHKKVIDEPMTLYDYMQRHPSQLGIRVLHVE